ncbi:unnamed protein product, partial [Polarella glacialis]
ATHSGGRAPDRLDWRSQLLPPPVFDVMKDKQTQRWGASLRSLLYGFPGGLAPVRLPLYSIIYVFDPAEVEDLTFAAQLIAQMPLPAKLHLLLLPPASAAEAQWDEEALGSAPAWLQSKDDARRGSEGEALASIAMAAAFDDLLHKKPKRAQRFLTAMAEAALSFTGRLPSSQ